MFKLILGALFAASFALMGISAASAAPVGPSLTEKAAQVGTLVQKTASGDYCSYLRYKCNHKSALGEWGEGNCRRYHQECGQVSYCERLRRACVYKEERGQEGQGNCRRYRYECGGGRGY
jgi:hypothetical protein